MSWVITPRQVDAADPDARAYLAAVEAADTQALEPAVRLAVDAFVVGCKADGIWTAIKASCILAGARTLAGALVPLVGTAPTNFNFVSGDYNRKTGLGDASNTTKYLATSRAPTRNNQHISVFASALLSPSEGSNFSCLIGARDVLSADGSVQIIHQGPTNPGPNTIRFVANSPGVDSAQSTGFSGLARATSTESTHRVGGVTTTNVANTDGTTATINFDVYRRSNGAYTQSRLAFYSIGEALNLALLDSRVTTLINAFAASIP